MKCVKIINLILLSYRLLQTSPTLMTEGFLAFLPTYR